MLSTLRIENSPFNAQEIEKIQNSLSDLNPAQTHWLSGYLAGRLAGHLQTASTSRTLTESVLSVIYATETGNSEGIAASLVAALEQQGIKTDLTAMGDLRPAVLRKLKNVVFIISTHGEGDPPDEALELFEYLESERAPGLTELNYRILALGDRSYLKFCEAGRKLDERLTRLGARPIGQRVECDIDFTAEAQIFVDEVVLYARDELATGQDTVKSEIIETTHLSLVPNESAWSRSRPYAAEVGQVQKITGSESGKDIYHIELLLEDPDLRYEAGDALGVWASNDPKLVRWILAVLRIRPSEIILCNDEDMTVSKALMEHREITRLTSASVLVYAAAGGLTDLENFFSELEPAQQQLFIEQRQFADLVDEYPAQIPAQTLVELLRPLAPRSYSIASSQSLVGEEAHLTVSTVYSNANGTDRQGVASGYLNQRLGVGERVRVFLEPNRRFRLPEAPDTPIIMIAAGTGIAPFRAFMQELECRDANPDSWLIFGNPQLRTDFLYQREWLRWRGTGLLKRIDTAWSRDGADKHYVQDIVREQAARIDRWLHNGASIYLCGSLKMGHAVMQALQDALAQQRRLNADEAAELISALRRERRIRKDLY